MTMIRLSAALLLMFSIALPAKAESYVFDKVHTQVIFFVSHLGFTKSEGEFLEFEGGFEFDPENWAASTLTVTIDSNSISMDDDTWNSHMKGKNFMNVDVFPAMTYVSERMEKTGENTGLVHGKLTLLGVTKPVTLDVTLNKIGVHAFTRKPTIGFSATASLKRSEFGMKYAIPLVGDDVEIRLEVEANEVTGARGGPRN